MEVRSRIWPEIDGEPVFGSGRDALLGAVERTGSINKAARELHISYRKALSFIQNMEKRPGIRLVERHAAA
jgi:molybdate transport system regulatory protein